MGWIDVLTDMVKGLRATGKSEKEIEAIVEQAAGRASLEAAVRRESNNWRKMHGLPMRRKGGNRNGRAGNSHRH